jgi:hypothetical protein
MRSFIAVGLCLLLASCGGEAKLVGPGASRLQPATPATASPVATPAMPSSATATATPIGPIVWTTAVDPRTSAPADAVTAYSPDARRIIAAVSVRGLPGGSTLTASWSYNNTSLDAFATQLTMTAEADETWVSFYLERSEGTPWPEGVYDVVIARDGQEVARSTVDIGAPA